MSDTGAAFYGFDSKNNLCFTFASNDVLHFLRISPNDLGVSSDTHPTHEIDNLFEGISWEPDSGRFWLPQRFPRGDRQLTEEGLPTGEVLVYKGGYSQSGDAVTLGEDGLLAFYGQTGNGTVVSYQNHRSQLLDLPCVPSSYGKSNDTEIAGVLCTTSPDRLPEQGGLRVQSSEFLLVKTNGPSVIWRHQMLGLGTGNREYFRWASPVVYRFGKKVWVVAPTKKPELAVYEVPLPEDEPTKSKPTIH
jgi:hypothetical protein